MLSTEERIKRIEQAPKDVQTMVAKAYLREDIPDEEIQYLFNTQPIDEWNDKDVVIENVNAETPEGTGAVGFTMRTSQPYDNKQYITRGAGGWSNCIKGNPTQEHANVLANCVGYASGRYNELIQYARDFNECRYTNLRCNASGFIERAVEASLEIGNTPRVGSIMCWGGGNGGCGHVAVVERVDSNNQVYTSESDYGGTAFFNALRTNDNGRWGLASSFYFRGFIYQQPDVQDWINGASITPNVDRDEYKDQLEVKVPELRVRVDPSTSSGILGLASMGYYNYFETRDSDGFTWYKIGDKNWIAYSPDWVTIFPAKPKEEVTPDVEEDRSKDQIRVKIDILRARKTPSVDGVVIGYAKKGGYYNYYEKYKNEVDGFTWYRIAEGQWVAYNPEWFDIIPKQEPTEPPTTPKEYVQLEIKDRKDGNVLVDVPMWIKE